MSNTATTAEGFIGCSIKQPTDSERRAALNAARELFPYRYPKGKVTPSLLTVDLKRWWGDKGQDFTVSFMDNPSQATRRMILEKANSWQEFANVKFVESNVSPMVRITRDGSGYWSYLGTDILGIPQGYPTMNLQGFTENSPLSEQNRVIKHEFGHTLGFPHEHMRPEIVTRIDVNLAIKYFRRTQGWTASEVKQQVLTPLNKSSIRGTPEADDESIMCYWLPGDIMKDGVEVLGGEDINPNDAAFIGTIYPKPAVPPPPPPDGGEHPDQFTFQIIWGGQAYDVLATKKAG